MERVRKNTAGQSGKESCLGLPQERKRCKIRNNNCEPLPGTRNHTGLIYNGIGYCGNLEGGDNRRNQYPTVESCAERCVSEFNSIAFAIYLRSWGYVSDHCECVPYGFSCRVINSSNARNYIIQQE